MNRHLFQKWINQGVKALSITLTLGVLISSFMFTVLAKDTRDMSGDGGTPITHQSTRRNEYNYSAGFDTRVTVGNPYRVEHQYGTTTLFNQSKSYGKSSDCRYLTFYYTGMGTDAFGYMTDVSSFMAHQY